MQMIDPKAGSNRLYVSDFVIEQMQKIPTIDAVPVVRCGECKHYHSETGYCNEHSHFIDSEGMSCSPAESSNWTMFGENDFCSYGERKEGVER